MSSKPIGNELSEGKAITWFRNGQSLISVSEAGGHVLIVTSNAPDDFKAAIMAQVKANGLLPDSTHVDASGQPVFTLQQLAQHYGVSEAEIMQTLGKKHLKAEQYTGPVFPLQ